MDYSQYVDEGAEKTSLQCKNCPQWMPKRRLRIQHFVDCQRHWCRFRCSRCWTLNEFIAAQQVVAEMNARGIKAQPRPIRSKRLNPGELLMLWAFARALKKSKYPVASLTKEDGN